MISFIVWSIDPEIFSLGALSLRYYGILFFLGFLIGYEILAKIFKLEGRDPQDVDALTVYMLVATIAGARLGHCLFYEPDYFLANPIKILYVWQGGLASHGAAVGILLALFLYSRKRPDQSYLYILDRIVITIALAAFFIRSGNFMNSEIVGKPTDLSTGVVFAYHAKNNLYNLVKDGESKSSLIKDIRVTSLGRDTIINNQKFQLLTFNIVCANKSMSATEFKLFAEAEIMHILNSPDEGNSPEEFVDYVFALENKPVLAFENKNKRAELQIQLAGIPRYPSQVYEAISSLILFALLLLVYRHYKEKTPEGLLFSMFLIWIFGLRFLYEFLKENQVGFEASMAFNMGQLLSIPLVLVGVGIITRLYFKGALKKK